MYSGPGATTRLVPPTPQLDSSRPIDAMRGTAIPESAEVARHQIAVDLARLEEMAQLTDADFNSQHPAVRAAQEAQLDIDAPTRLDDRWMRRTEPQEPDDESPPGTALTGEAKTVDGIEHLTPEGLYQIVALTCFAMTRVNRPYGLAYPQETINRVEADPELAPGRNRL